jgi:hypothetical protein
MDLDTPFKHISIALVKVLSIHVEYFTPVLFNYPGRLTDNLNQVAGTGYSLKLFLEWAA